MKGKKNLQELYVGLFILLCLAGLVYLTASTGKLNFRHQGYYLNVIFAEAGGLQLKAPVLLNGLEVGKVDDLSAVYEGNQTAILAKLWIDDKAKIRQGSTFSVQMMGMMGEKYIQVVSSNENTFIMPDSVLQGEPYVDLAVLISNLNNFVLENGRPMKNTIANLETISENFIDFSEDLKRNPWKLLFKTREKLRNP